MSVVREYARHGPVSVPLATRKLNPERLGDHFDRLYRAAWALCGSREDAEDLVQETYARAFRTWKSYTPGTNLRAWLLRILTNLNIDRGRRNQRAPQTTALEAPAPSSVWAAPRSSVNACRIR